MINRIKALMKQHHISQSMLAKKLNLTQRTISSFLTEKGNPTQQTIQKLDDAIRQIIGAPNNGVSISHTTGNVKISNLKIENFQDKTIDILRQEIILLNKHIEIQAQEISFLKEKLKKTSKGKK